MAWSPVPPPPADDANRNRSPPGPLACAKSTCFTADNLLEIGETDGITRQDNSVPIAVPETQL
jgi:hypothetical protein